MKYALAFGLTVLSFNLYAQTSSSSLDVLAQNLSGTYFAHDECKTQLFGGQESSKGQVILTAQPSGDDRIILSYDYQRMVGKDNTPREQDAILGGRIEITEVDSLVSRLPYGQPNLANGKAAVILSSARGRVAGAWSPERPVNTSLISTKSAAWKNVVINVDVRTGTIQLSSDGCDGHVSLNKQ
jgi:hypothetical protein